METQETKIAIVILNWNGKKWLEKFLPCLVNNSQAAKIYVADNNSNDESIIFLQENFPSVNIIINKINNGYAKGYNDALKKISAKYFVLINSDVEVTKGWLEPIIKLMDSNNQIAACQPKVLDYNYKEKFEYAGASGGYIDKLGYPFCRGRIFNHLEKDEEQYNNATEIFWATGACLFIRSKAFDEVNGFDEDFFAHQEEIDLCWRLKNKGYLIMVEPKSYVYHVGGGTLNASSPFKTYLNFRNNLSMLFKNLPILNLIIVILLRLILDGIAAMTFLKQRNGLQHLLAVIKAHFSFYHSIPKLIEKRKKINQNFYSKGKIYSSILIENKIKKRNKFSEIKIN